MKRLLTAAIGVPLALLATFKLPVLGFFVLVLVLVGMGSLEYVQMLRPQAPNAPLWLVPVWTLPTAYALFWCLQPGHVATAEIWLLALLLFLTVGVGTLLLAGGVPPEEATAALGIIGIGVPYFALPIACLTALQGLDPWLLFLLYAIVWLGDTAAYYVGSAIGKHKMAPIVSPNKSWEGAAAGFLTGLLATAIWSVWRLGELRWPLLAVAAVVAVAAQLGDLFESLLKRGVHTKDSGHLLPGHGGMFDRMDAMLFAAPVMLAGLMMIGHDGVAW